MECVAQLDRATDTNPEVGSSNLSAFPFYHKFYIIFKLLNKAQRVLLVKVELLSKLCENFNKSEDLQKLKNSVS